MRQSDVHGKFLIYYRPLFSSYFREEIFSGTGSHGSLQSRPNRCFKLSLEDSRSNFRFLRGEMIFFSSNHILNIIRFVVSILRGL